MDEAEPDRFVEQLRWVAREAGGVEELARRSRVSGRTLQSWLAGRYPRQRSSRKLPQLDWALSHLPGYPPEGTSSLADLAGPVGMLTEQEPPPHSEWGRGGADNGPLGPDRPARRSHRGVIIGLVVGGVLVVAGVLIGAALISRGSSDSVGSGDAPSPSVQAGSSTTTAGSLGGLPSGPVDSRVSEQTGKFGANTFADPRTGSGQGTVIPPFTTVLVQCRFYSPIMSSLEPDGYWYLIVDEPWANTWAPANSFMNGDEVGRPVQHYTDLAVPVCQ